MNITNLHEAVSFLSDVEKSILDQKDNSKKKQNSSGSPHKYIVLKNDTISTGDKSEAFPFNRIQEIISEIINSDKIDDPSKIQALNSFEVIKDNFNNKDYSSFGFIKSFFLKIRRIWQIFFAERFISNAKSDIIKKGTQTDNIPLNIFSDDNISSDDSDIEDSEVEGTVRAVEPIGNRLSTPVQSDDEEDSTEKSLDDLKESVKQISHDTNPDEEYIELIDSIFKRLQEDYSIREDQYNEKFYPVFSFDNQENFLDFINKNNLKNEKIIIFNNIIKGVYNIKEDLLLNDKGEELDFPEKSFNIRLDFPQTCKIVGFETNKEGRVYGFAIDFIKEILKLIEKKQQEVAEK